MQVEAALFYNEISCVLFDGRAVGGCVQNKNHGRYRPLKLTSRNLILDNMYRCIISLKIHLMYILFHCSLRFRRQLAMF